MADHDLFDFSAGTMAQGHEEPFLDASPFNFDDISQPHFTAINEDGGQNDGPQTVSPQDLHESLSGPSSTTFTNYDTPATATWDSPYMADSADTSPFFDDNNLEPDADKWPSLFPPDSGSLPNTVDSPLGNAPSVAPPMTRSGSSPGSRSSHGHGHSSVSGVNPKRRDKPLPPITIEDPSDTVAVKRARNTMAARKSRQKRMERQDELTEQVDALQAEVERWKDIATRLGHRE